MIDKNKRNNLNHDEYNATTEKAGTRHVVVSFRGGSFLRANDFLRTNRQRACNRTVALFGECTRLLGFVYSASFHVFHGCF